MSAKDALTDLRYLLAARFSKAYSAKRRWLQERNEWESLGIAHTDIRRKIFLVPRTGAVFIAVSKCANTTLKFMLFPERMNDLRGAHRNDNLLKCLVDGGLTLNDLLDGSRKIFTFSRHPVSRFWSAYFTKLYNRPATRAISSNIIVRMKAPIDRVPSPEIVLEYVKSISPIEMDEHFRPQWACTGIERLPIGFIGRVETMNDDVIKLLELGYLDSRQVQRFQHLNQSEDREIPDKERIDRIIRDVYAKDMELFGYE